ncbi:protein DUF642 L-GALACTONO-1,4-LACTONE-RESPONSIVE GENE 2 [Lactuca sativa]|uniref:DUF642 domain-containing protein n=1 Tax=Lactuca sativa TaxID=4236 RepID=A0A9R1UJP8_LACSA|nr:protein DUF642 L-GALACTONO-1,4-LACTONE-RESPONSIVE GENE 2 [Lactuca sativa]KAJ0188205.1 hypothetical protein LSAT_V11C900480500 [Lactuca sativa]
MALVNLIFILLFLVSLVYSKVTLENSGFESPPTNLTTNSTSQFILLDTKTNRIPGWSFNGTVWYVTAGENVSLPGNGHGVQLGPNGMINQTFKPDGNYDYVLTFTLAPSSPDCANSTSVNVSGPSASEVFFFRESLGTEMWQTYAYSLWSQENKKGLMSLQIQSTSNSNNITCWPIVDTILVTGIHGPRWYSDNGFVNSGFEVGPAFIENSSQGVLLEADSSYPDSSVQSPLQYWTILGIVKYIDSKHYAVPRGGRAVELVSGNPSGIVSSVGFLKHGQVTIDFIMGDANDSCVGDFLVFLQVGDTMIWNFTMRSIGVGSREAHSVTFMAEFSNTESVLISFTSFNETRTSNNVLCGPVIDSTVLRFSDGLHSKAHKDIGLVTFSFLLAMTLLIFV